MENNTGQLNLSNFLFYELKLFGKITWELMRGLIWQRRMKPYAVIYGSAKLEQTDPHCQKTRELARLLSEAGFDIMTGAGPGIMQAANQGAHEGGSQSYGCNIVLPSEQRRNPYVTSGFECEFFGVRKYLLRRKALGAIVFPGGLGTMDELFEILTLLQNNKMRPAPVFLIGTEYWKSLSDFFNDRMLGLGMFRPFDLRYVFLTDDFDFVLDFFQNRRQNMSLNSLSEQSDKYRIFPLTNS